MRDSLQAMSLVNSAERIWGFGMFSCPRCVPDRWSGRLLVFHRLLHTHPGESGQLAQMLWRVPGIIGGRSHIARQLKIITNCYHLMRSLVCQALLSVAQFISDRTLGSMYCHCSHFTDKVLDKWAQVIHLGSDRTEFGRMDWCPLSRQPIAWPLAKDGISSAHGASGPAPSCQNRRLLDQGSVLVGWSVMDSGTSGTFKKISKYGHYSLERCLYTPMNSEQAANLMLTSLWFDLYLRFYLATPMIQSSVAQILLQWSPGIQSQCLPGLALIWRSLPLSFEHLSPAQPHIVNPCFMDEKQAQRC